jgi:hypothetical protein
VKQKPVDSCIQVKVAEKWLWQEHKMNPREEKTAVNWAWEQKMTNLTKVEERSHLKVEIPLALDASVFATDMVETIPDL